MNLFRLIAAVVATLFSLPAFADRALSARIATLGLGVDYTWDITRSLHGRVGAQGFTYGFNDSAGDIDYDLDFELKSGSAMVDWYPTERFFRVTGGLLFNGNEIKGRSRDSSTYEIGEQTYTSDQVGTLSGMTDFPGVAPFIGIGFGNPLHSASRVSLVLDIGVVYQGSPDVALRANGPVAQDPDFQRELAREEQEFEDSVDGYRFYPLVAVGLAWTF